MASTSSPLADGSPGRASTVVAPASAQSPARPSPGTTATTARWRLAPAAAPSYLAEVGDADPVRAPRFEARLDGRARIVHMDMDVPQAVAADDDQ